MLRKPCASHVPTWEEWTQEPARSLLAPSAPGSSPESEVGPYASSLAALRPNGWSLLPWPRWGARAPEGTMSDPSDSHPRCAEAWRSGRNRLTLELEAMYQPGDLACQRTARHMDGGWTTCRSVGNAERRGSGDRRHHEQLDAVVSSSNDPSADLVIDTTSKRPDSELSQGAIPPSTSRCSPKLEHELRCSEPPNLDQVLRGRPPPRSAEFPHGRSALRSKLIACS